MRACDLNEFVLKYTSENKVDRIVVGLPTTMNGQPSESQKYLLPAIKSLQKAVPLIPIVYYDERFTSVIAHRAMIDGGMKKSDRRDKANVDMISAAIILNDYLQKIN